MACSSAPPLPQARSCSRLRNNLARPPQPRGRSAAAVTQSGRSDPNVNLTRLLHGVAVHQDPSTRSSSWPTGAKRPPGSTGNRGAVRSGSLPTRRRSTHLLVGVVERAGVGPQADLVDHHARRRDGVPAQPGPIRLHRGCSRFRRQPWASTRAGHQPCEAPGPGCRCASAMWRRLSRWRGLGGRPNPASRRCVGDHRWFVPGDAVRRWQRAHHASTAG
jgi:hypothetical protein